jgi:long-chain fatty acid transport protein
VSLLCRASAVGRTLVCTVVAAVVFGAFGPLGGRADAAGLSRPSVVGARAIGLGGAFTAIADDPTAAWHNPSGLALYGENVAYLGGELVFTQRAYTPDAQSTLGMAGITGKITERNAPTFIPIIGLSTRFGYGKAPATRFAFGISAYDAYGGSIAFVERTITSPSGGKAIGVIETSILNYELAPTLAYQVSDVLSVGAALRIGINEFSVKTNEPAFSADLHASGVGVGATLGVMVRPHRIVQIGAVYRSPLSASISGNGDLSIGTNPAMNADVGLKITWPQSAGLGIAVTPHPRFMATVQADWTGWSSVQRLDVTVSGANNAQSERYRDSWAARVGLQAVATRWLLFRLGWAWDSNAVPDRTMRRENTDGDKSTLALGIGVHFWKIFIDTAFEAFLPIGERKVTTAYAGENETGRYDALVFSGELSAQIRF